MMLPMDTVMRPLEHVFCNGHRFIDLAYGTGSDQWTCDVLFHLDSIEYMVRSGAPRTLIVEQLSCIREHLPEGGE